MRRENRTLLALLLPAGAFFGAFFLLPLARLFLVGGSGTDGFAAYATIITDRNHFASLLATLALAAATTVVTLIVSGIAGVFLQRNKFPGNAALVAMLTLPLAFPGVVIGFMVIMLAGRQGLIGDITPGADRREDGVRLFDGRPVHGLRLLLDPAHDPHRDGHRREARPPARGSGPLARRLALARDARRHHPRPEARVHLGRRDLLRHGHGRVRHRLHAGHPHQRAADGDLYRVHAGGEHRRGGGAVVRAGRRHLGRARASPALPPAAPSRRQVEGDAVRDRGSLFYAQLAFTLLVCAFLIVPVILSMLAGLTANYLVGIASGLTLRWVGEVWDGYRDTIFLSIGIALACLACTLVLGVPTAYVLAKRQTAFARALEELLVMPVAVPGLATALALIITYGGAGGFRTSWVFILVGHVLFTLPFMVRSVLAVLMAIDLKTLEEGAASLGASFSPALLPHRAAELPRRRARRLADGGDAVDGRVQHDLAAAHAASTRRCPSASPTPMPRCAWRSPAPTPWCSS